MIHGLEAADIYLLSGLAFYASGHWICGSICIVIFAMGVYVRVEKRKTNVTQS